VKASARAGTRALGTTRRASTRGFGAALARLSVWRWMRSGERVREHRGGVRAYRIRWGRWGTPRRSSRRRSRSDPLDRLEMADPVGTGLIATYPLPNRDLLAAVGAVLSAELYLLRFLGGPLETRTPDPLIKSSYLLRPPVFKRVESVRFLNRSLSDSVPVVRPCSRRRLSKKAVGKSSSDSFSSRMS